MTNEKILDMACAWGITATPGQAFESKLLGLAKALIAAEREACAVIAETPFAGEQDDITMEAKDRVVAAIRARSNQS